jgi:hypothetical protein
MKGTGANALAAQMVDPQTGSRTWRGRMPKPSFKYLGPTAVVVPASSVAPIYLNIGGNVYTVTSNMECNSTISGVGGLFRGGSLEANTVYYLYAVAQDSTPYLVMDKVPPTEGIGEATYIGALRSSSTPDMFSFSSSNGFFSSSSTWMEEQAGGWAGGAVTPMSFTVPTTVKKLWMRLSANSTSATGTLHATSLSGINVVGAEELISLTACVENRAYGFVNVFVLSPPTIYYSQVWNRGTGYASLFGWIEDPSEYA